MYYHMMGKAIMNRIFKMGIRLTHDGNGNYAMGIKITHDVNRMH